MQRTAASATMTSQWTAAAAYCAANPTETVLALRHHVFTNMVPHIDPHHFAPAIRIAIGAAPPHVIEPDFSPVQLFDVALGSSTSQSPAARELFEILFVGLGAFPSMVDDMEWDTEPTVNTNPRNVAVKVGLPPGTTTTATPDSVPPKQRLLDLAQAEVTASRYEGPYTIKEAVAKYGKGIVVSSAFFIEKLKAITTKRRLVHNGSSKRGNLNASTVDDYQVRLDHTAIFVEILREQLRQAGDADVLQLVADVSKCYRRIPTRASDRPRFGLRVDAPSTQDVDFFDGTSHSVKTVDRGQLLVYFDTRLPFGTSASVSSCVRITNFMRDLVRELLIGRNANCCAFIDDFCCVGTRRDVELAVGAIRGLMQRVGLPENDAKRQHLSQFSVFLGIQYDLNIPSMTLPAKKQQAYLQHVDHYLNQENLCRIKRVDLQSLVGKLAHASQVFAQSRIFYQRLLAALRTAHGRRWVPIGQPEIDDLRWWRVLLSQHSGTCIVDAGAWGGPDVHKIYTDASSSTGYGVMWQGEYFYGKWDEATTAAIARGEVCINNLELICLTFALETFGHRLRGKRILFRCDNTSVVHNVEAGTSPTNVRAAILRRLYVVAALHGIELKSTWIPTAQNEHADALSRGDLQRFFSLTQNFPLSLVSNPQLQSAALLLHPLGSANPSSPSWVHTFRQL